MRNLSIVATRSLELPFSNITKAAFDAEHDCAYLLSERPGVSPEVEVEIFKVDSLTKEPPPPLAIFSISANGVGDFSSNKSEVVSFKYVSESQSLSVITSGGDVGLVSVDDEASAQFEIIGSIDEGIYAANWSPDDSLLTLITGDNKLLLMSSNFDVIVEQQIKMDERGENEQVNVGWGSKKTQFHGSLGKAAAQAVPTSLSSVGASPDDDECPRISWRGDGALFIVSLFQPSVSESKDRERRVLRVYDRQGVLQNTTEPIAGLEHTLEWRPSGNLIASSQRFGFEGGGAGKAGRHDIVFFEKNGLRHGEFTLREDGVEKAESSRKWGYKVRDLFWNADSDVLAVWLERDEGDAIQLWTTGNYHWYLKQEILAPKFEANPGRFTHVSWHPERALDILFTTSNSSAEWSFVWDTLKSHSQFPVDTGSVAVVDGTTLLLTPFRTQNVPPPMASCSLPLKCSNPPIHTAFSPTGDHLAVLHHPKLLKLWKLQTRLASGRNKAIDPLEVGEIDFLRGLDLRQTFIQEDPKALGTFNVGAVGADDSSDVIVRAIYSGNSTQEFKSVAMPDKNGRLLHSVEGIYWQSPSGNVFSVNVTDGTYSEITRFPTFCFSSETVVLSDSSTIFIGLSRSGKLYCSASSSGESYLLTSNGTSYVISAGFVIYTTSTHEAFFAPLEDIYSKVKRASEDAEQIQPQWERRRVERGSRIVTAVPSSMSLVLQMPRGNLETINPRPMVLVVVKQDIKSNNYRKAFLACRKHRIDLSILVEYDPKAFLENISSFVEQIDDVDHLNLFLTGLSQSSLDAEKVSKYCDAVRAELEARSLTRYVNSILTAYVVKKPADYESSLALLLRIREADAGLVEEAVKYIIFLVDANKLFDTALGMYDFSLVLLIAQHSQKDPREYLPFLRDLRALPKFYQRHKIDDHLRRHSSALKNLHTAGPDYFNEALSYVEKHALYHDALYLWVDSLEEYKRVLNVYGEYLFERREFRQAATVFIESGKLESALVAYERALLWREALDLATRLDIGDESLSELSYRIGDELLTKKRYDEAARVFLDYSGSVRSCINALLQGNLLSEARRIITLLGQKELLEELVYPATLDTRVQIAEDLEEMRSQLHKQVNRLRELRVKKEEEPDAFYGIEDDPTLHSVDVMTDVSMAPTAFTRYTVAASTTSKASKRTSRSKRKMERKVGSGRKGTIDEEEYLLKSIGKLVARFDSVQNEASQLLLHLLQFTDEHRNEARALQTELSTFRKEVQDALDELWVAKSGESVDSSGVPTQSWAERMEEKRRERKFAVENIPKPDMSVTESTWKVNVLDL